MQASTVPWSRRHLSNQMAPRTSDGDVEALGAAHEAEVVALVELELAHLVRSRVRLRSGSVVSGKGQGQRQG